MKIAIYPGSFDPITLGHFDIIKRASKLYDQLIVVIMENPVKNYLFTVNERLEMLQKTCENIKNVTCCVGKGLTIDFARQHKASVIIRGIRAVADYEYELQSATTNMMLEETIETVFLLSKPHYSFLSSSAVKEVAKYGGKIDLFVDEFVVKKLKEKLGADN